MAVIGWLFMFLAVGSAFFGALFSINGAFERSISANLSAICMAILALVMVTLKG